MLSLKQIKLAEKRALQQGEVVSELKTLAKDIVRCEQTIRGLKNNLESVNAKYPNPRTTRDDIAYLTYFNAGLRIYDIRDARTPKEIAYFIPPDPKTRIGTKPSKLVAQTEDVLVDRRGFIYISNKNQGVWILKLKEVWPYSSAATTV